MDFRFLFDLFPYQAARYPQKSALAHRKGAHWETFSTQQCLEYADRASSFLLDHGVGKGDTVAIYTQYGSAFWTLADLGIQQIGAISVPIHGTAKAEDVVFILEDSGARICLTDMPQKLIFPGSCPIEKPFERPAQAAHLNKIAATKSTLLETDLATILYTSGTTGKPKGVMLTHRNIVSNIKSVISLIPVSCDHTVLSFLPLSHIFERMVVFTYIAVGASVHFTPSGDTLLHSLRVVRPHYFATVPRLLERFYEGIYAATLKGPVLKRRLLRWAIRIGERYGGRRNLDLTYWLQLKLADLLVFRRWRRILGGRVEGIAVGAAALSEKIGRLFSAAGVRIREGYGLTESAPVVSFNRFEPGLNRFGTVGIPIPGVDVRIAQPDESGNGEIQVRGPNVMLGYWKLPEETRAAFTADGWLRTGDVGRFVHKYFLQITDRQKDIFKTSTGKYVAPQAVENHLKRSPFIEDCLVVGFQRPYLCALIHPHFEILEAWCAENGVHWTAPAYMAINPKVEKHFATLIEEANASLESHERIRHFLLLAEPWTTDSGELTPTLKPIRPVIEKRWEKEIEKLYV